MVLSYQCDCIVPLALGIALNDTEYIIYSKCMLPL